MQILFVSASRLFSELLKLMGVVKREKEWGEKQVLRNRNMELKTEGVKEKGCVIGTQ